LNFFWPSFSELFPLIPSAKIIWEIYDILVWKIRIRAFFSGKILPDVSESDEPAVVPPKSGQCSKASRGDTGQKEKP